MMILSAASVARLAVTSCAVVSLLFGDVPPSHANTGFDGNRLQPCPYESNCVSSNYLEPPNRYISPLTTVNDRDVAFQRAIRDLKDRNVVQVLPRNHYIHLTVPGTAPGSLDDVEVLFGEEGIINLRCESRVRLPPPPFCVKRNCINGNMDQRTRVQELARVLGLPSADQERMQSAKWTPLFFNADRVPDFED
jgi:uncharacterized protein (DUF1499 family)